MDQAYRETAQKMPPRDMIPLREIVTQEEW
jgi:hypothetical protein